MVWLRLISHRKKLSPSRRKYAAHLASTTLSLRSKRIKNVSTFSTSPLSIKPYSKPGNIPQYINRQSNHPPPILLNLPSAINRRLSNISSDKCSFDSAAPPYQEALKKSGYSYTLNFDPQPSKDKRSRQRNILRFNPPYSANVATNIGHTFLKIIDESFPKTHPLHKVFSTNPVKLSYSCMPSMEKLIRQKSIHI